MKSVFANNDYLQYLRDHFEERKVRKPAFSHRFLLRKMGVTSSGFLADILLERRIFPTSLVSRPAMAATMDPAKEAIDGVHYSDRDISTLTLALSDRVFQCNLQLFPLSRR